MQLAARSCSPSGRIRREAEYRLCSSWRPALSLGHLTSPHKFETRIPVRRATTRLANVIHSGKHHNYLRRRLGGLAEPPKERLSVVFRAVASEIAIIDAIHP